MLYEHNPWQKSQRWWPVVGCDLKCVLFRRTPQRLSCGMRFKLAVSHYDGGYLSGKLGLQRGLEGLARHQTNYFRIRRIKYIDNPSAWIMMDL